MNLKGRKRKWSRCNLRHYGKICQESLGRITKKYQSCFRVLELRFKPGTSEYESGERLILLQLDPHSAVRVYKGRTCYYRLLFSVRAYSRISRAASFLGISSHPGYSEPLFVLEGLDHVWNPTSRGTVMIDRTFVGLLWFLENCYRTPLTVTVRSKARIVLARSDTGDHGFKSYSRHGCLPAFILFVLSCVGSCLATGWPPV
jgi:hypothetical protein